MVVEELSISLLHKRDVGANALAGFAVDHLQAGVFEALQSQFLAGEDVEDDDFEMIVSEPADAVENFGGFGDQVADEDEHAAAGAKGVCLAQALAEVAGEGGGGGGVPTKSGCHCR